LDVLPEIRQAFHFEGQMSEVFLDLDPSTTGIGANLDFFFTVRGGQKD